MKNKNKEEESICPECKQIITELIYKAKKVENGVYRTEGVYDDLDSMSMGREDDEKEFECPECGAVLTEDECEADDILNGVYEIEEETKSIEKAKQLSKSWLFFSIGLCKHIGYEEITTEDKTTEEENCDHEFEKKEVLLFGDNSRIANIYSRIANICKHCGGEKEEMEG